MIYTPDAGHAGARDTLPHASHETLSFQLGQHEAPTPRRLPRARRRGNGAP